MERSPTARVAQRTAGIQHRLTNTRFRSRDDGSPKLLAKPVRKEYTRDLLHRAVWMVTLDVDASKHNRDHESYKYRDRPSRIVALGEFCKQHALRHHGKSTVRNFTGRTLYKSLQNIWSRLQVNKEDTFDQFWRQGRDVCRQELLQEFEGAHDALPKQDIIFPAKPDDIRVAITKNKEGSTAKPGDQAIVKAQFRRKLPEEINSPRLTSRFPAAQSSGSGAAAIGSKRRGSTADPASAKRSSRHGQARASNHLSSRRRSSTADPEFAERQLRSDQAQASDHVPGTTTPTDSDEKAVITIPRSSPDRLTLREVEQELGRICDLQLGQVLWLCEYKGLDKCSSPLTPQPTLLLETIYKRCWGHNWESEADELLNAGRRSIVDDTMALFSAFLYEQILIREFDEGLADTNNATPAPQDAFSGRMENLITQLSAALCPYFLALTQLSDLMHAKPSRHHRDPLSQPCFRHDLAQLIQRTSALKDTISMSSITPKYFWPEHREAWDPTRMQVPYSLDSSLRYTVAFTKFPGVVLTHMRTGMVETNVAYKACVVLRARAAS